MSISQVGIVDTTGKLDSKLIQATAIAINIQVMRDLPEFWNVQATISALPDANNIPIAVWPVFLVERLPRGEGGVHLDKNNQPYALVIATTASNDWTIDASHETIEMLVDPAGNRMEPSQAITVQGKSVQDAPGQFSYLVEPCDPCEGNQYAYNINGIAVSDFITPHFYDPVAARNVRYSFGGNVTRPRQVLPGGYVSFVNPVADEWEQILFLGPEPVLRPLGPATGASLRAFIDGETHELVRNSRTPNPKLTNDLLAHREFAGAAADRRARSYKEQLERCFGK